MKQSIRGIFTGFMLAHDPTARAATIVVTPWRGTMRCMVTAMLSMFMVVAATAGVASATDQSKFNSLIGKNAADIADVGVDKFSPKAGCVCRADNLAGVLVRAPGVALLTAIYCVVPVFATDGSFENGSRLCADFLVLPK